MAVTLTVNQVAVGLRLITDPTAPVPEPYVSLLSRSLAVAMDRVEREAPDAPVATQNAAAIRICGWLFDARLGQNGPNAYRDSGAASLLAPYIVRRSAVA